MGAEEVEQMAENHAEFIKQWYKAVFLHGYKHGREDAEARFDGESVKNNPVVGPPPPAPQAALSREIGRGSK